jgi:hypothetical protein
MDRCGWSENKGERSLWEEKGQVRLMEGIRFHRERFGRFLRQMEGKILHQAHSAAANQGEKGR